MLAGATEHRGMAAETANVSARLMIVVHINGADSVACPTMDAVG